MTVGEHSRYLENVLSYEIPNARGHLKQIATEMTMQNRMHFLSELNRLGVLSDKEYGRCLLSGVKDILEKPDVERLKTKIETLKGDEES